MYGLWVVSCVLCVVGGFGVIIDLLIGEGFNIFSRLKSQYSNLKKPHPPPSPKERELNHSSLLFLLAT